MLTDPESDYSRGSIPFLDCTIHLTSRPLIPRTETEFWTEKAIKRIEAFSVENGEERNIKILDLFAGSGAIGVAVLKHVPNTFVDFGEIDPVHVPTINKNVVANGISKERARVWITNVWSSINDRYDFILSNPPYIDEKLAGRVQESVKTLEPHLALFASDNGFSLIEKMLLGLREHMTEQGTAWIEHEPEQVKRILETAERLQIHAVPKQDQYGVLRYSELSFVA